MQRTDLLGRFILWWWRRLYKRREKSNPAVAVKTPRPEGKAQ
jgi:hypothetical protein